MVPDIGGRLNPTVVPGHGGTGIKLGLWAFPVRYCSPQPDGLTYAVPTPHFHFFHYRPPDVIVTHHLPHYRTLVADGLGWAGYRAF